MQCKVFSNPEKILHVVVQLELLHMTLMTCESPSAGVEYDAILQAARSYLHDASPPLVSLNRYIGKFLKGSMTQNHHHYVHALGPRSKHARTHTHTDIHQRHSSKHVQNTMSDVAGQNMYKTWDTLNQ
jgi:hypothetical protein